MILKLYLATTIKLMVLIAHLSLSAAEELSGINDYRILVTTNTVNIKLCSRAQTLVSTIDDANRYLTSHSSDVMLAENRLVIKTPGCHRIRFQLESPLSHNFREQNNYRSVPTGLLVWVPNRKHNPFKIIVESANNLGISLPLAKVDTSTYLTPSYAPFYSLPSYLGRFEQHHYQYENIKLRINMLSNWSRIQKERIKEWLAHIVISSSKLLKQGPFDVQVNVKSIQRRANEPIPWALVHRGEGTALEFFLAENFDEFNLMEDWTGYHEMAHLALPFIDRRDAWLSEGFASYFQYFLMTKGQTLDGFAPLQNLRQGIARGEAQSQFIGKTLTYLSENLRALQAYRRVYWHGALFWFEIDIQLRLRQKSLAQLIRQTHSFCSISQGFCTGESIVKALDHQLDDPFIESAFRRYQRQTDYPSIDSLFERIGVQFDRDHQPTVLSSMKLRKYLKNFW